MLMTLAALVQAASLQPAPAPDNDPIVVTAKRLRDAGAALADCRARRCPPKEEIDAAMTYAERQFLDGDYRGSRRTLLDARHRNARYARTLPVEVAELMSANATLANMNGYPDSARINTIDSLDALKRGLDPADERVLMQRLAVGTQFAHEGRLAAALEFYGNVERRARQAHLPKVEGQALLRSAVLLVAIANVWRGHDEDAKEAIGKLAALTGDDMEPFRLAGRTLERTLGDYHGSAQAAIKAVAADSPPTGPNQEPVLLYAQRLEVDRLMGTTLEDVTQWANIAFRVAPDGSVRNIAIVGRSPHFDERWADMIKKTLASRIYRPVSVQDGVQRIERYSVTHDPIAVKGTRFRPRGSTPRIEVTDITATPSG